MNYSSQYVVFQVFVYLYFQNHVLNLDILSQNILHQIIVEFENCMLIGQKDEFTMLFDQFETLLEC